MKLIINLINPDGGAIISMTFDADKEESAIDFCINKYSRNHGLTVVSISVA